MLLVSSHHRAFAHAIMYTCPFFNSQKQNVLEGILLDTQAFTDEQTKASAFMRLKAEWGKLVETEKPVII